MKFEAWSGGKEDNGPRNENALSCDPGGKCPNAGWKTDISSPRRHQFVISNNC